MRKDMKLKRAIGLAFNDLQYVKEKLEDETFVVIQAMHNGKSAKDIYESVPEEKRKKTIFVCIGLLGIQLLISKYGRKLKGKFLILDYIENLIKAKCYILDSSKNSGRVIKTDISELEIVPIMDKCKGVTIFPKEIMGTDKKNDLDNLILLMSLKEKQKTFKATLQEVIRICLLEIEPQVKHFKKYESEAKEQIVKCISNYYPYDKIEKFNLGGHEIKTKKAKDLITKWSATNGGKRTIRAFQDIAYFGTSLESATNDNLADPFSLELMLKYWKTSKTEFKFNKMKGFEDNIHDIPESIVKKREKKKIVKGKNPKLEDCEMQEAKLVGTFSKNQIFKKLGLTGKLVIIGSQTKDKNVILKENQILSIIDVYNKKVIHIKIVR